MSQDEKPELFCVENPRAWTLESSPHWTGATSGLPDVPGGWHCRVFRSGSQEFRLTVPAEPDAFLDDPAVLEANRADDYMPYWGFLWPAAPPMVGAVLAGEWTAGATALEIGCGIGLVGLAALRRGLTVTFSDYDQTSVDLALHNARQNGYDADGLVLDWRRPVERKFDVILGSDVTYEVRNHGPILDVISQMLNPGGVAWIGDAGRQISAGFPSLARDRKFQTGMYDASGRKLTKLNVGEFQMFVLRS